MSSKQRVRPIITLISPEGKTFEAKWIGDSRSSKKKIALFNFINIQGTVAQNLKSMSRDYPFTIMFDGPEHDITAQEFFDEYDYQDGLWEITHPTKGYMVLQPKSVSEDIQPVKNANGTTFTTEWMEPIDPATLLTGAQLAALQGKELNEFNELSSEQFAANVSQDNAAEIDGLRDESLNLLEKIKAGTKAMAGAVTEIQERMNNAQLLLEDVLDSVILDPLMIAGMIQGLVQTPGLALQSLKSRMEYYGDLANAILGRSNEQNTSISKNASAVKELGTSAIIGAYSIVGFTASKPDSKQVGTPVATGPVLGPVTQLPVTEEASLQTKDSVQKSIDDIVTQVQTITDGLDADQEKYQDLPLQWQFFAQSKSFQKGQSLTLLTVKFLAQNFYSARIEKRFILKVPSTPIQLTIEKYGSMGENDSNYTLFVASNKLKGDEIYLLPKGFEVVIYA